MSKILHFCIIFLYILNSINATILTIYASGTIDVTALKINGSNINTYSFYPGETFKLEIQGKNNSGVDIKNMSSNFSFKDSSSTSINSSFNYNGNLKSVINYSTIINPLSLSSYDNNSGFHFELTNISTPTVINGKTMFLDDTGLPNIGISQGIFSYQNTIEYNFYGKSNLDNSDIVGPLLSKVIYINVKPHITEYFFSKDGITTSSTIQGSQNESIDLIVKVKDYNGCSNIDGGSITADLSLLGLGSSESLNYDSCEGDGLTAVFKKTGITTLESIGDKTFSYSDFSATDEDGNTIDPNDNNTTFDDEDKKTDLTISIVAADAPTVTNEGLTDDYIGGTGETTTDISFSATQDGDSKVALNSCDGTIIQDWTAYNNGDTDTVTINSAYLSEGSNTLFVCVKNGDGNIGSFNFNVTKDTTTPSTSNLSYTTNILLDDADITFQCNEDGQYKIDRITPSLLEVVSYTNINKDTNTTATILNGDTQLGSNTFRITCKDNAGNTGVSSDITITKQEPTPSMDGQITLFEDPDSDLDGIDGRDIHLTWNTNVGTGFTGFQSWRIYLLPSNITLDTNTHTYIKLINNSAIGEFTGESTLTNDSAGNTIAGGEYKAYIAIMGASGMLGEAGSSSAVTLISDVVEHATIASARFTSDTNLELTTDSTLDTNTANHDATKITYQIDGATKTGVSIASIDGQKINITIPSIGATDKTGTNLSIEADAIRSAIGGYNFAQTPAITISDAISPSFIADLSKSTAATYSNFYHTSIDFSWDISEELAAAGVSYLEFIRTGGNAHVGTNNKVQFTSTTDLATGAHTKTIDLNTDDTENVVLTCGTTYKVKMTAVDLAGNTSTSGEITNIAFDNCAPTVPTQTLSTLENTLTPTLSWSASTDDNGFGSGVKDYTLIVYNGTGCVGGNENQTITTATTSQLLTNLGTDQTSYSWKVLATDEMTNASVYSACDDFTVDTTVPAFSNEQISDTTIGSTTYITQDDTVVITANITNTDIDHIWMNLASITGNAAHINVNCATPEIGICTFVDPLVTYTITSGAAITDGNKQVQFISQNTSGGNEQTKIINTTSDSTAPVVAADTISSPITGTIGGDSVDIVWNQSKITDSIGIDHIEIEYSTDGTNWTNIYNGPKTSPYAWDISLLPTANDYRLKLKAFDLVGNSSEQTFALFNIDLTAPIVPDTTITYPNGGEIVGGTINITWDNTKITDSSLLANPITLEYTTDGTNWNTIAENEANDGTYSWATPSINNSTVKIRLTATDTVGNQTSDLSDADFSIDSVNPNLAFTYGSTVPHGSNINNSGLDISATTSDANMFKTYYRFTDTTNTQYWNGTSYTTDTWNEICAIGGGANSDCDNINLTINPTITEGVNYKLELKTEDIAGNETISLALEYTGDTTIPTISTTTSNGTYFKDTISLAGTSSDNSVKGISSVKIQLKRNSDNYYWNGTDFVSGLNTLNTVTNDSYANWTYEFLPTGSVNETYEIKSIAYDRAYKTYNSNSSIITLNRDFTEPNMVSDISGITSGEIIAGGDIKTITWISGDITDTDSGLANNPITLEYLSGATWINIATNEANDGTYDWTIPSIDISSQIRIKAIDNVDNIGIYEGNTFIIDSTGPTINFTDSNTPDSGSFINGNGIDISFNSSDVTMDKVYYKLVNDLVTDEYWDNDNTNYTTTETWNLVCTDGVNPGTDNTCDTYSFNTVPTIIDGNSYNLYLKATDEVGHETITVFNNYTGDTIDPTLAITTASGTYFKDTITLAGTSSDAGAGIANVNIQIKKGTDYWNGTNFVSGEQTLNTTTGDSYANWSYDFAPIGTNESYEVKVIASDNSYKINNTTESIITINQDKVSPIITGDTAIFTSPLSGDFLEGGATTNITWTAGNITDADSGLNVTTPIKLEYFNGSIWVEITNMNNDGTYTWTVPSIDINNAKLRITATDNVGNITTQLSDTFSIDSTVPTITGVETMDMDTDGQIDALQITMSENIKDSTITLNNFNITESIGTPTSTVTGDSTNDNIFVLKFSNTGDTSTIPNITYTSGTLTDLAGKFLATTTESSTDKAVPRLLSSSIFDENSNGKLDKITATFSENINFTTDTAAWTINNLLDGASISSVSTSGDTATILLNESTDFDTSVGTMDLTFTANSNWKDSSNNQAGSSNNLTITDEAKPIILSSEYTDNNSNYIVDQVTITLSENVTGFNILDYTLTGVTKNTGSITDNIITLDITEAGSSDSGVTASFDLAAGSLKDLSDNQVDLVNGYSISDKIAPAILSKETIDSNSNGQIDTVRLTFSEDINSDFSSFVAEVDGYTLPLYEKYTKSSDNIVDIKVEEKSIQDTGATPQFRISSNSSLKDLATNTVETTSLSNLTDSVGPVITGARFDEGENKLYLTFSESINDTDFTTSNLVLNSAGASVSIDSVDTGNYSVTISSEEIVYGTSEISFVSDTVRDSSDNKQASTNYTKISASIIINEYMNNGDVEYIELKNISSATVDISGWQIINVLGDGVHYTIPTTTEITSGGYYLLATTDASFSGVAADDIAAVSVISNITLKNGSINVDSAIYQEGTNNIAIERKSSVGDGLSTASWYQAQASVGFDVDTKKGTPGSENIFDATAPTINSYFPSEDSLLPMGSFDLSFDYTENVGGLGVDITSDSLSLFRYDGLGFNTNSISSVDTGNKTITETKSTYPINNLGYGKYQATFSIDDNAGNRVEKTLVFYVDALEFTIDNNSLDLGTLVIGDDSISSGEITITIKTVGAGFNLNMNKTGLLTTGGTDIIDYNSTNGFGYDIQKTQTVNSVSTTPTSYDNVLSAIDGNDIGNITGVINTSGEKNTYIYKLKYGANINTIQAAGVYKKDINFNIGLTY